MKLLRAGVDLLHDAVKLLRAGVDLPHDAVKLSLVSAALTKFRTVTALLGSAPAAVKWRPRNSFQCWCE